MEGITNDERADEHGDAGEEEGDDGGPPGEDSHITSTKVGRGGTTKAL